LRTRGGSGAVDVAGGKRVEVSYGEVRIRDRAAPVGIVPAAVAIEIPGEYPWPGGQLEIRIDETGASADQAFDADRLTWPLVARARRPGDRMRPRGGRGSRKLSDLMIDAKVPRLTRDGLPVVATADDQVLFAPGLRPAEVARPTTSTRRFLRIVFAADLPLASRRREP
jgi:tRNA(Ile)-lysidine synthetase-like protein